MPTKKQTSVLKIFAIFLRLGLTSFGGPIAHLGYFKKEFVDRLKWFDEHAYTDLVALCQFLPGPASSQVGIALGFSRGGYLGALVSWLGFTLPSAMLLVFFGLGVTHFSGDLNNGWVHGLKIVAVAVVAQAIWSMGSVLCADRLRASLAVIAAVIVMLIPSIGSQIAVIIGGGIIGCLTLQKSSKLPHAWIKTRGGWLSGSFFLTIFFALLLGFPFIMKISNHHVIQLFDTFFRTGSLVFGGGHVVLPLLQSQVVSSGWVSNNVFLAGYGIAQAIPGPLFTFAAYLGAVSTVQPSGWLGAAISLIAIFLPSFLLIFGVLPFWERLRRYHFMQRAMLGINAVVVGLLLAAFYNPVWTSAIQKPADFSLAIVDLLLLTWWRMPPWLVVLLSAGVGEMMMRWA